MGFPLIAGDVPIGTMGLFIKEKDRAFAEVQMERAQAVATMAAMAVHNARLLSEANQRAEEAQALIQTARSVSASLDQETVLNLIAEKAKDLLQADGSRIQPSVRRSTGNAGTWYSQGRSRNSDYGPA
jgi:GAF domain-containing protein